MKSIKNGNSKKYFQENFRKLGRLRFSNGIGSEGENKATSTPVRKEVENLELTPSQQETIRYQFESYCKKVIREKYRDCVRQAQRYADNEVSFSELSQREMDSLSAADEYPIEYFHFQVYGEVIEIKDERLYNALSKLSPDKRDIVLLAHYLGKSDVEIAEKLNQSRSTVQYQRTSSLAKLKIFMGG